MHYKKFLYSSKKVSLTKKLVIWSSLFGQRNSPPGFLSLRKMHSTIPHVANSLLDWERQAVQLNTDCWIFLWRIRNTPSPRKSVFLFPNVPCIWKDKSLSPKYSIWTSANEQKFTTVKWLLIQQTKLEARQLPAGSYFTGSLYQVVLKILEGRPCTNKN